MRGQVVEVAMRVNRRAKLSLVLETAGRMCGGGANTRTHQGTAEGSLDGRMGIHGKERAPLPLQITHLSEEVAS